MVGRLEGKNAIVTGAAGGIGLETTILMLREGASVLMTDISEAGLQTALDKANKIVPSATRTGKVETKVVDVSKEASVEAAVAHLDSWGGLDVIFNNAGIMHADDADAIDTPEKIWDLTQNINVKGVWFGSKHAVQSFRKHGKKKGSVINTASMVALVGAATPQLAYTASKGAVLAMTRELAIVHAREGEVHWCLLNVEGFVNVLITQDSGSTRFALHRSSMLFSPRRCFVLADECIAPLCSRTGSVMTRRSDSGAKCISPLAGLARLLSRLMRSSSWPVMSPRSSMRPTS